MRQKGFTLVELLVTLAITAVLGTGAVLSLHQALLGSDRSRSQVTALSNIDQAVLAIKADLMVTQTTSLTDGNPTPQSSVNLTWIDYTMFETIQLVTHTAGYSLNGTDLWRVYNNVPTIVGRNITSIGFTRNGRLVNVNITATGPGVQQRSETLQFSGFIRSEETVE